MKILITGFPGTGKSTIAKVLKSAGRNAYDPQSMQTYMHIEDQETGRHIQQPSPVPKDWFDTVGSYNWDAVKIEELLHKEDDVFICSLAGNQSDFYAEFDKIFVLTLDDEALTERLRHRGSNSIGHADSELSAILEKRRHFEASLLEHGATPIDVGKPVEDVVQTIFTSV